MGRTDQVVRAWSAFGQYPERKQFYFGTVVMPVEAKAHEIDAALKQAFGEVFPIDYPPTFNAVPGIVFFQGEE